MIQVQCFYITFEEDGTLLAATDRGTSMCISRRLISIFSMVEFGGTCIGRVPRPGISVFSSFEYSHFHG